MPLCESLNRIELSQSIRSEYNVHYYTYCMPIFRHLLKPIYYSAMLKMKRITTYYIIGQNVKTLDPTYISWGGVPVATTAACDTRSTAGHLRPLMVIGLRPDFPAA